MIPKKKLVSIIIPIKNSEKTLETCLKSCLNQTYKNCEVIVIDNFSTDKSAEIGAKFPRVIWEVFGHERNLQRPRGAELAKGEWLVFIDSDMELSPNLIENCLKKSRENKNIKAFILPEVSEGVGFWSRCKIMERSCYLHYKPMEGVRMMERKAYDQVGGWDKNLIAGEDYDLFEKFQKANFEIARSNDWIIHNEGKIEIIPFLKKKYYYGKFLKNYLKNAKKRDSGSMARNFFLFRTCYYKHWKKFFRHPFLYIGMFFMVGITQVCYFLGMHFSKK